MNRAQINSLKCEFENLPKVKEVLEGLHHTIIWFGDHGLYHTSFDFTDTVNWLNGGFYIFCEINGDDSLDEAYALECAREAMFKPYKKDSTK